MLTHGVEVWTEVGGVHIGKIWEAFHRVDENGVNVLYVRCQKIDGSIFERKATEVHNISELYERGQNNGPKNRKETELSSTA